MELSNALKSKITEELKQQEKIHKACDELRERLGEKERIPVWLPLYVYLEYMRNHNPAFYDYIESEMGAESAHDMVERCEKYFKMLSLTL